MAIDCPYNNLELQVALVSLDKSLADFIKDNGQARLVEIINEVVESQPKNLNESAAEYHRITPKDLANSPNREILLKEFGTYIANKNVSQLKVGLGISHKEAWALLLMEKLQEDTEWHAPRAGATVCGHGTPTDRSCAKCQVDGRP